MAAIIVDHLYVRYRGAEHPALGDVSLRVGRGECVLLTGATGCGKTTLLRTIAGLLQAEQVAEMGGMVFVNGVAAEHVNRLPDAPRAGVVFQNADDQLTGFTPREEIAFALENLGVGGEEAIQRIDEALAFADLAQRADDDINTLSGGQKQRICLAAVLAMQPDVLLLDEPVSSLDAGARRRFINLLMTLKQRGATMVIGTHEPERFAGVADRSVRLELPHEAVYQTSSVIKARASWRANQETTLLEVCDITARFGRDGFQLGPVSFSVRPGERIALLGPNGGGKSTLLSVLAGIVPWQVGEFFLNGKSVRRGKGPDHRDVAVVSQNPDLMLFGRSVEEEVRLRPKFIGMDRAHGMTEADELLRRFLLEPLRDRSPFSLSQGQRQRLAIAAALAGGAELILIDEPTTGQDQEHVEAVLAAVDDLADGGAAILFSTHNLAVAAALAERALVLVDGALVFDGAIAALAANGDQLTSIGYGPEDAAILSGKPSFGASLTREEAGA